jgi:predicted permease
MATTSKALARTAAATSNTTLYTVPSSTTAIVTNIAVTNTAASAATFTLNLNGVALLSGVSLGANTTAFFDIKQTLIAAQTISGSASAVTVNFHISGVEVA